MHEPSSPNDSSPRDAQFMGFQQRWRSQVASAGVHYRRCLVSVAVWLPRGSLCDPISASSRGLLGGVADAVCGLRVDRIRTLSGSSRSVRNQDKQLRIARRISARPVSPTAPVRPPYRHTDSRPDPLTPPTYLRTCGMTTTEDEPASIARKPGLVVQPVRRDRRATTGVGNTALVDLAAGAWTTIPYSSGLSTRIALTPPRQRCSNLER